MSTSTVPAEQRVVLDPIAWPTYLALLSDADRRRGLMTYNRGVLELMSPSKIHEQLKVLLGRLIEAFTEYKNIDICSVGSTTFKREDLRCGIEADECYYLASAAAVRDKDEIDLSVDPPPDLAVEIDISRTSTGKLEIYAALEVAEVWRYDGDAIRIYVLGEDGRYEEAPESRVISSLPVAHLTRFLHQRAAVSETQIIRSFRQWLLERDPEGGDGRNG